MVRQASDRPSGMDCTPNMTLNWICRRNWVDGFLDAPDVKHRAKADVYTKHSTLS